MKTTRITVFVIAVCLTTGVLVAADCRFPSDCGPAQYCAKDPGQCDGPGVCRNRPDYCITIFDPVCGCNGQTYGNACEAAAAGVNVAYKGSCAKTCKPGFGCGPDYYCYLQSCIATSGVCIKRPAACLDVWDPVCACDGKTYSNACYAAMAGATVARPGPCETLCGANGDCPLSQFCYFEDCLAKTGICTDFPLVCPDVWMPVCGFDGQTYGNDCQARMAGVSVAYQGECKEKTCSSNENCGDGNYCRFAKCGDAAGTCQPRPVACPAVWDPVCGCDRKTYGNDCEAAVAGVSIRSRGECPPPGPTVVMKEPATMDDDVHTGPTGVDRLRVLFSEPVVFVPEDITVVDENGNSIPVSTDGSGTAILTIVWPQPLMHDRYTVTIRDSVVSAAANTPIDGDRDGFSGGPAVIVMEHRQRADLDNNNRIDLADLVRIAEIWLWSE
jgi:hypothetical protein